MTKTIEYTNFPNKMQKACKHYVSNRTESGECNACGSKKIDGKWNYLTPEWYQYFVGTGKKPI